MTQAAPGQGLLVTPSPTAPRTGYLGTGKKPFPYRHSRSLLVLKAEPEKVTP